VTSPSALEILLWAKWWPQKDTIVSSSVDPVNMALSGKKKISVDIIKDLEIRRSPWIIWIGPKSNNKCPHKRHMEEKAM